MNSEKDHLNKDFYSYLLDNSYLFDKETVENYLLSLKVKPFVILTGNSGTGKTRLSQLFAKYLSIKHMGTEDNFIYSNSNQDFSSNNEYENENDFLTINVKLNQFLPDFSGISLSQDLFREELPINYFDGEHTIIVEGISAKASIDLNPVISFSLNSPVIKNLKEKSKINPNQDISIKINLKNIREMFDEDFEQIAENIVFNVFTNNYSFNSKTWTLSTYVFFHNFPFKRRASCEVYVEGIKTDSSFEFSPVLTFDGEYLIDYLKENFNRRLELVLKTSQFMLNKEKHEEFSNETEENKTGDNQFQKDIILNVKYNDEPNYKIVPVGANWTENRHIVGYYNVITDEYQDTPAYNLIEKANQLINEPYFLILDEMNHSHVERYFADFLSAIESGEKIPLYGNEEDLVLPPNLSIIGTVNIDETTYMFSPKVLDRANVIEFDTSPTDDYMKKNININPPIGDIVFLENPLSSTDIRALGIKDLRDLFENVIVDGESFWKILSEEIFKFQEILKESRFDFGFRVINEIVRFMAVAWEYEGKPSEFTNWERYFDAQIKQKILPKLHGSEKIIGDTIKDLEIACLRESGFIKYKNSYRKLEDMKNVLDNQRYVSFIN